VKLIVGTDSTWSLRVWLCSQLAQLDFDLKVIDLTCPNYKAQIRKYSPTGLVPALISGSLVIHDSLAIAEYINERSDGTLFPSNEAERAISRSLCAELHSGFINLRTQCPFSLEQVTPLSDFGSNLQAELSRLVVIFEQANLPFMFDTAGSVDAFYSILAYRLKAYGVNLEGKAGKYQQSLLGWDKLQEAICLAKSWAEK
jgi:glutathione S-transferase